MVRKYCPKCKEYSYSATGERVWLCPTCGYNLTNERVLNIGERSDKDNTREDQKKWLKIQVT